MMRLHRPELGLQPVRSRQRQPLRGGVHHNANAIAADILAAKRPDRAAAALAGGRRRGRPAAKRAMTSHDYVGALTTAEASVQTVLEVRPGPRRCRRGIRTAGRCCRSRNRGRTAASSATPPSTRIGPARSARSRRDAPTERGPDEALARPAAHERVRCPAARPAVHVTMPLARVRRHSRRTSSRRGPRAPTGSSRRRAIRSTARSSSRRAPAARGRALRGRLRQRRPRRPPRARRARHQHARRAHPRDGGADDRAPARSRPPRRRGRPARPPRRPWSFAPTFMLGRGLDGKTLGIVGFGRIGREVARLAEAFGMRVVQSRLAGGSLDGAARRGRRRHASIAAQAETRP